MTSSDKDAATFTFIFRKCYVIESAVGPDESTRADVMIAPTKRFTCCVPSCCYITYDCSHQTFDLLRAILDLRDVPYNLVCALRSEGSSTSWTRVVEQEEGKYLYWD